MGEKCVNVTRNIVGRITFTCINNSSSHYNFSLLDKSTDVLYTEAADANGNFSNRGIRQ